MDAAGLDGAVHQTTAKALVFMGHSLLSFVVQLLYALYEGFVRSYYLLDPIFYNDFFLFLDGTRYVLRNLQLSLWQYVGGLVLILLIASALFWLSNLLFASIVSDKLTVATRGIVIGLLVLAVVSVAIVEEERGSVETAVSSFTAKLNQNVKLSRDAKAISDQFDSDQLGSILRIYRSTPANKTRHLHHFCRIIWQHFVQAA